MEGSKKIKNKNKKNFHKRFFLNKLLSAVGLDKKEFFSKWHHSLFAASYSLTPSEVLGWHRGDAAGR